jgi:hypothetical protein
MPFKSPRDAAQRNSDGRRIVVASVIDGGLALVLIEEHSPGHVGHRQLCLCTAADGGWTCATEGGNFWAAGPSVPESDHEDDSQEAVGIRGSWLFAREGADAVRVDWNGRTFELDVENGVVLFLDQNAPAEPFTNPKPLDWRIDGIWVADDE